MSRIGTFLLKGTHKHVLLNWSYRLPRSWICHSNCIRNWTRDFENAFKCNRRIKPIEKKKRLCDAYRDNIAYGSQRRSNPCDTRTWWESLYVVLSQNIDSYRGISSFLIRARSLARKWTTFIGSIWAALPQGATVGFYAD